MDFGAFTEYVVLFFAVFGGLVALATPIVGFTKTAKDDIILSKVVALLDWLSVLNPRKPA